MSGIEIGTIAAIASVGSAAVGAMGAIQQGQAANAAADYNAKLAEREAQQAEQAAALEERRHRERVRRMIGSQRAAAAAGGGLEGTPLLMMGETAMKGEIDALLIRNAGSERAVRARSQAALDRMQGQQAQRAGYMGAGSSLLSGATSLARYYDEEN
ncbi:hypothetical protein [Fodinicurvata sediminis]|uniref:hypothetical protein n=1 Tax=Fodinicurvata sediminis TaxID=1121832 RepID=UPI0003B61292|nr:hypothetical protein [Fodinicurvata sediminis]